MSPSPQGEAVRQYSSRALTDTTCVLLWTPLAGLRSWLRPLGLDVVPVRGAPRAMHPVWIDLGHIKSGAGEALQLDQHAWWRRVGAGAGGALGWASGNWWGGIANYWGWAPSRDAGAAADRGRALGVDVAERLSNGLSRTLGTYREAIVSALNVVPAQRRGGRYSFVLGMHTDSPIAIWGDRALRYGYGKQLCRISGKRFESYVARASDGAPLLSAELSIASRAAWQSPNELPDLERMLTLFSQPLLGHLGGEQFALSFLERATSGAGPASVAPTRVRLTWSSTLAAGLPSGELVVPALSRRTPWGAFSSSNIATRVTYPQHLKLTQL